jgi:hypothetical protein
VEKVRSNPQQIWLRAAIHGLAFLFLLPVAAQAANTQATMSNAMKSLLRQTNAMYLSKLNSSVDKLVNSDPMTFASVLGVTMQRQGYYADQNPQFKTQYWTLRHECYGLLAQVARAKNNTNPQDGTPMTAETLKEEFLTGLRGKANSFFIQNLGINPANADLPMILTEVSLPKSDGTEIHPRLPVRHDPNAIVLGGETALPAESVVEAIPVGPSPKPQPQKPHKKAIGKGAILGQWRGFKFYMGGDGRGEYKPSVEPVVFNRGSGREFETGRMVAADYYGLAKRKEVAGPELYRGKSRDGIQYFVIAEKQVDQYTVEYKAYVKFPKHYFKKETVGWMYSDCNMNVIDIRVRSAVYMPEGTNQFKIGSSLGKGDCKRLVYDYCFVK